jgi:hypothetical protein
MADLLLRSGPGNERRSWVSFCIFALSFRRFSSLSYTLIFISAHVELLGV